MKENPWSRDRKGYIAKAGRAKNTEAVWITGTQRHDYPAIIQIAKKRLPALSPWGGLCRSLRWGASQVTQKTLPAVKKHSPDQENQARQYDVDRRDSSTLSTLMPSFKTNTISFNPEIWWAPKYLLQRIWVLAENTNQIKPNPPTCSSDTALQQALPSPSAPPLIKMPSRRLLFQSSRGAFPPLVERQPQRLNATTLQHPQSGHSLRQQRWGSRVEVIIIIKLAITYTAHPDPDVTLAASSCRLLLILSTRYANSITWSSRSGMAVIVSVCFHHVYTEASGVEVQKVKVQTPAKSP